MDLLTTTGVVLLAVFSITSHEAAHGFVANWFGDPTAKLQGRLTLNPLPHIDLVFTILLPLFLIIAGTGIIFGGAKPVPVNISRLHNPRRDWALVGIAGPAMNLAIAIVLTVVLAALVHPGLAQDDAGVLKILALGIFLNVLLAVFNLIPVPPLDGSRVLQYFLSSSALETYRRMESYGLLIIVALLFLVPGFYRFVIAVIFGVTAAITAPFGVWHTLQSILQGLLFT
ncbi:MAG: site-2 protease family protein [Halioglobus sp.]|nr:site-2 protease family protein [Halioglobus sp.]